VNEKKKLLNRYQHNCISVKESIDILVDLLGLDMHQDIPFVLEKLEDQHSSIEFFSTQLTEDLDKLIKRKEELETNIHNQSVIY
jgi:hypothetical protein